MAKLKEEQQLIEDLKFFADELVRTGYFLDVAALPGAERIVGISLEGETHTWTRDQAEELINKLDKITTTILDKI